LLSPTAADEVATVEKEIFVVKPAATAAGGKYWFVVISIIVALIVAESGGKGDSAVKTELIAGGLVLSFSSFMVDGGDRG
jgi:hypothetical protein